MEFESRTYYSEVEFEFLEPSETDRLAGGITFAFVEQTDARLAISDIEAELKANGLKAICFEYMSDYTGAEWETEEDQEKYDALAAEARKTRSVVFDDIWAYRETD
ncbi:MAG: hypothetical protein AAGA96_12865 [Verrucomicrobiota bacterium]